jgi:hypothetical protein
MLSSRPVISAYENDVGIAPSAAMLKGVIQDQHVGPGGCCIAYPRISIGIHDYRH